MIKSLRRVLIVFRKYRARLVISQILVLTVPAAMIGVAALNQRMIDEGIEAGSAEVVLETGMWMFILASYRRSMPGWRGRHRGVFLAGHRLCDPHISLPQNPDFFVCKLR